jgi:hypothetical protein
MSQESSTTQQHAHPTQANTPTMPPDPLIALGSITVDKIQTWDTSWKLKSSCAAINLQQATTNNIQALNFIRFAPNSSAVMLMGVLRLFKDAMRLECALTKFTNTGLINRVIRHQYRAG